MRDWTGKRYWIVGASEGLGRAVAQSVSRAGAEVIVSSRTRERLDALVEALPGRAQAVTVDVADAASVRQAAEEAGPIDGLIFMAGVYWPMKATEWNAERAVQMADINFTGAMRVLGAVVPQMVDRDAGHIVLTGSLAGFRGLPGAIGYGASKAAIMSLAESMRADLRGTGIEVQLVNPGFIRTRMTEKNEFNMPFIMEPETAAREIFEHMNSDRFARSFPGHFGLLFRGGRFLPEAIHQRLFRT